MRATQPKAEKRLSDEKLIDKWKKEGWPQRIKPIDYFVASDGDSFQGGYAYGAAGALCQPSA
jgi:hypothetical protein